MMLSSWLMSRDLCYVMACVKFLFDSFNYVISSIGIFANISQCSFRPTCHMTVDCAWNISVSQSKMQSRLLSCKKLSVWIWVAYFEWSVTEMMFICATGRHLPSSPSLMLCVVWHWSVPRIKQLSLVWLLPLSRTWQGISVRCMC